MAPGPISRSASTLRWPCPVRCSCGAGASNSEWEGQLRVAGTSAAPRVSGTLRVRRGGFELLGHRFDLRGGTIAFDGQTPPDPQLQIDAVTQAERITAIVRITGKAKAPEFRLDSEPSLPEDEVLARLLFNRATSALGPADAVRLAAAANTLRGGGVGLLGRTRQTFGLDTLDVTGAGLQDGQVRAGKYLNDRVFVEVGKGAAADSEDVSVEIEILPNLSLDADANAQAQTGIGLKWRFDYLRRAGLLCRRSRSGSQRTSVRFSAPSMARASSPAVPMARS